LGKAVVARQYITAPPHERLERFWSAGQSPENIEHWSLPEPLPQHRFLFGIQIRVGQRINTRYIQPHYSGASTSPRAILLSGVVCSKSLAAWRSGSWLSGSPKLQLTFMARLTAGRSLICFAQRCRFL